MANLPERFLREYDGKGDSFHETAALLYSNHGHQYTQTELSTAVDVSQTRISAFTEELVEDGWLDRHDGQTTFVWNTERHNPAETAATDAVLSLYHDLWRVLTNHARTAPGIFALIGFGLGLTGGVLLLFSLALAAGLIGETAISAGVYLGSGLGFLILAVLFTAAVSIQTTLNRLINKLKRPSENE